MKNLIGLAIGAAVASGAFADLLTVQSYDMLNGQVGSFTYLDDSYNGSGDPTVPLSPLSGGTGQLTDGVVATQNWFSTPGPYVGWDTVIPDITFHFAGQVRIDSITLYLDDSNGNGGVAPPSALELTVGGVVVNRSIPDLPSGAPFFVTYTGLDLVGDSARVRLFDGAGQWVFVSEVIFEGVVPAPASVLLLAAPALGLRRRR